MLQQRDRWPEPVACRVEGRSLLWRRADILVLAGVDPSVQCLICERRFRSLGPHLAKVHGVTAAEYRAEYRLPAMLPLMGDATRRRLVETTRAAMDADPGWVERMRVALPPLHEIARASAEMRAVTDSYPLVRAARAAGARGSQPATAAAKRAELLRRIGYASVPDALAAVDGVGVREAAERLGVGRTTIRRWRAEFGTPQGSPRS